MADRSRTTVGDLHFEILRRKTHIFCNVREDSAVAELKKIIAGILKVPLELQSLRKLNDDGNWQVLEDRELLSHCGFTQQNARAQQPAPLGLVIIGEDDDLVIDALSTPPPVPDAMRPDQNTQNEQ